MFRLLRTEELVEAAELLWKRARNRPAVRQTFHHLIYEVLIALSSASLCRPSPTKRFYRDLVKSLEYVRDNDRGFRRGEPRIALERAIDGYRLDEKEASKTRPKDPAPRMARVALKSLFERYYGMPVDDAAAILLRAAFPETKPTAEVIRRRRREQKNEV